MRKTISAKDLLAIYKEDEEENKDLVAKDGEEEETGDEENKADEHSGEDPYPIEDEKDLEKLEFYDKLDLIRDVIDSVEDEEAEDFLAELRRAIRAKEEEHKKKEKEREEEESANAQQKANAGEEEVKKQNEKTQPLQSTQAT